MSSYSKKKSTSLSIDIDIIIKNNAKLSRTLDIDFQEHDPVTLLFALLKALAQTTSSQKFDTIEHITPQNSQGYHMQFPQLDTFDIQPSPHQIYWDHANTPPRIYIFLSRLPNT